MVGSGEEIGVWFEQQRRPKGWTKIEHGSETLRLARVFGERCTGSGTVGVGVLSYFVQQRISRERQRDRGTETLRDG